MAQLVSVGVVRTTAFPGCSLMGCGGGTDRTAGRAVKPGTKTAVGQATESKPLADAGPIAEPSEISA